MVELSEVPDVSTLPSVGCESASAADESGGLCLGRAACVSDSPSSELSLFAEDMKPCEGGLSFDDSAKAVLADMDAGACGEGGASMNGAIDLSFRMSVSLAVATGRTVADMPMLSSARP